MNSFEIEIKPEWLCSGYYLYVARITYKRQEFVYIGQTGDNNYHSARAPLYRIGGHFAKGTSTENQIIKYFKKTVLNNKELTAFELEQELRKSSLKYTFFKIDDYSPKDSKEHDHLNKRMRIQAIEHYVIYALQDKARLTVLNTRTKESYSSSKRAYFKQKLTAIERTAVEILNELGYE
jgi:hypothetical protein